MLANSLIFPLRPRAERGRLSAPATFAVSEVSRAKEIREKNALFKTQFFGGERPPPKARGGRCHKRRDQKRTRSHMAFLWPRKRAWRKSFQKRREKKWPLLFPQSPICGEKGGQFVAQ